MVVMLEEKQPLEKNLSCNEKDIGLFEIVFFIYCQKKKKRQLAKNTLSGR